MENNELMDAVPTNLNKGVVVAGAVLGGIAAFVLIPKVVKAVKNRFGKKVVETEEVIEEPAE